VAGRPVCNRAASRARQYTYPSTKENPMDIDTNNELETKADIPLDAVA
jgi:hypothetical protein